MTWTPISISDASRDLPSRASTAASRSNRSRSSAALLRGRLIALAHEIFGDRRAVHKELVPTPSCPLRRTPSRLFLLTFSLCRQRADQALFPIPRGSPYPRVFCGLLRLYASRERYILSRFPAARA